MEVCFTRTGERRYAASISSAGGVALHTNPAPGYDDRIPHDLVHYLVEAVLKLDAGVFGRAARGGSSFLSVHAAPGVSPNPAASAMGWSAWTHSACCDRAHSFYDATR